MIVFGRRTESIDLYAVVIVIAHIARVSDGIQKVYAREENTHTTKKAFPRTANFYFWDLTQEDIDIDASQERERGSYLITS